MHKEQINQLKNFKHPETSDFITPHWLFVLFLILVIFLMYNRPTLTRYEQKRQTGSADSSDQLDRHCIKTTVTFHTRHIM